MHLHVLNTCGHMMSFTAVNCNKTLTKIGHSRCSLGQNMRDGVISCVQQLVPNERSSQL
jgi:hypothetical protein